MPRPDYVICLECQSEVDDFIWREGEVRRATCDVCGNSNPDSFSLPEDFDQALEDDEEEYEDDTDEEKELLEEYDDVDEEEEEEA